MAGLTQIIDNSHEIAMEFLKNIKIGKLMITISQQNILVLTTFASTLKKVVIGLIDEHFSLSQFTEKFALKNSLMID